jgi:hypothetical protein
MLWRVNVAEVVRASALAIRRRNEILGPLAKHDPMTKEMSDVLARGNLTPPNHWSVAWIDLLRGVAQAGVGKLDEADMLLGRSVVIDGQFDHPLTCVALMEQGRLAMIRGDSRRAAQLFDEAGVSAYYFENWDVVTEAAWFGWINHMASGAAGVYPALEPVAAWAQLNRMQHIATKLRLAQAESLLWLGQADAAATLVEAAARRMGDMRVGLVGIHQLYVMANLQLMRGQSEPGGQTLAQALAAQAAASLRNFQIARASEMYDTRAISPRIAVDLYQSLLTDPAPADWAFHPLDAMAVLATAHDAAFDRWFIAALERKDHLQSLEVAEKAKRRRYLASLRLGGRLLALGTLLEAPNSALSRPALLQRQQLLAMFPAYRQLLEEGAQLSATLRSGPIVSTGAGTKTLANHYEAWARNAADRQNLLMQLAPRRLPSAIEFPPLRTPSELRESLADGEAILLFHAVGENVYGFLITRGDAHLWEVGNTRRLRSGIGEFLRALGNYGPNRSLSFPELSGDAWKKIAAGAYSAIFDGARLDVAKTTGLIIVPDDVLWYLPFDALIPDGGEAGNVLADRMEIRYGPTAALAVSRAPELRRPQHTAIVANELTSEGQNDDVDAVLEELEQVVIGPVRLAAPLPQPPQLIAPLLDGLIVFDEVDAAQIALSHGLPIGRGRSGSGDAGNLISAVPYGGPERIIATGFATAAEQGLKGSRRGAARNARPGSEVFHAVCSLMSEGARTVLMSRWRTGGETNFDLVREFAQELPTSPATQAWQRACLLARESPVDPQNEPRLKGLDESGELPTADHPFFWAGYLLVDTSPRPASPEGESSDKKPADESPSDKATAQTKPEATDEATPRPAPERPLGGATPQEAEDSNNAVENG